MTNGRSMFWAGAIAVVLFLAHNFIAVAVLAFMNSSTFLLLPFLPGAFLIAFLNIFPFALPTVAGIGTYLLLRDSKSLWYLAVGALIWPLLFIKLLSRKGKHREEGYIVNDDGKTRCASGFPSESILRSLVRDPIGESSGGYFISSLLKRNFARTYKDNVSVATEVISAENQFFEEDKKHHITGKEFLTRQLEKQYLTPQVIADQLAFEQQREDLERKVQVKRLQQELGVSEPVAVKKIETKEAVKTASQKLEQKILALAKLEETKKRLLGQYPDLADVIRASAAQSHMDLSVDDLLEDDSDA